MSRILRPSAFNSYLDDFDDLIPDPSANWMPDTRGAPGDIIDPVTGARGRRERMIVRDDGAMGEMGRIIVRDEPMRSGHLEYCKSSMNAMSSVLT